MDTLYGIIPHFYIGSGRLEFNLIAILFLVFSIPYGGLVWLIRNGFYADEINAATPHMSWTANKRRTLGALAFTLPIVAATQNLAFFIVFPLLWRGIPTKWLFKSGDIGRSEGRLGLEILKLSLTGGYLTLQVSLGLFLLGCDVVRIATFASSGFIFTPLVYLIGWELFDIDFLKLNKYLRGIQYGQFLYGVYLASAFAYVII